MALIDIVKWEMNDNEVVYKFPSDDLRLGTQLVVYPSQTAFFVKGGVIFDEFTSGTYTLDTNNIPILNKVVNLPFGSESPFQAEVWFVNQTSILDVQWGTPQPLQLEDPKYKIIVPVRAYGQYGIKITNPKFFLETLIGNQTNFSTKKIEQYFKGKIVSHLNTIISKQIVEGQTSVLDINTQLIDISNFCENQLNVILEKYGINLVEFSIMSINVPQDDESVIKLKNAKDLAARLNVVGRDTYQMERSFDVLQNAANNVGIGGQMIGMGLGLGAGIGVSSTVGSITSQILNTNPPPLPMETTYYLYLNGQQIGGQTIQQIETYIRQGVVNGDTMVWCIGMSNWKKLQEVVELSRLMNITTPPPLNL
jgi:membrane protease subunit (stomatin/prohibitin family)